MEDREQEIPGTSVKVVRVGGNDRSSRAGRTAATTTPPRYRTMEEKVRDIERYLIWQVDVIRKWVAVAVGLSALCAIVAVVSLWILLRATDGEPGEEVRQAAVEAVVRGAAPPVELAETEKSDLAATRKNLPVVEKGDLAAPEPPQKVTAKPAAEVAPKPMEKATAKPAKKAAPKPAAAAKPAEVAIAKPAERVPPKPAEAATPDPGEKVAAKQAEEADSDPAEKADAEPAEGAPAKPTEKAAAETAEKAPAKPTEKAAAETEEKVTSEPAENETPAAAAPELLPEAPPVPPADRERGRAEPPAGGPRWSFRVGASAIATRMAGLDPVGTVDRFPAGQKGRLYCWTRIETDRISRVPRSSRFVIHRWIHDDTIVQERKITIGSARYRIYSMVPNPGDRPGQWRVEIIDAEGRVIGTSKFVVD